MKTDVISVSSRGTRMDTALSQVDKMAAYKGMSHHSALHLRLLTEEMMAMMRSITGENEGRFWIEDEDQVYQLHLLVTTRMDSTKREQLLSTASSGRNESARGLMGRIRDFFDRGADEDLEGFSSPLLVPGSYEYDVGPSRDWEWSMTQYEKALVPMVRSEDRAAREAWDELEKSVVARVADDVKVSIRGSHVEMTIIKKISE